MSLESEIRNLSLDAQHEYAQLKAVVGDELVSVKTHPLVTAALMLASAAAGALITLLVF